MSHSSDARWALTCCIRGVSILSAQWKRRRCLLAPARRKSDFDVRAPDGIELRGWKVRPPSPNGDWVLLFHGVSDNRTGVLGAAEILLRHGYSVVMMDARAHGESGGAMATYGWKERYDTVAITSALYATEKVPHLYALGVSMGAAIALQSAAVEPRIEGVIAEDPLADLREIGYDYTGLHWSPLLGKTLFRPAAMAGMAALAKAGGFNPDDVSPEKAVAARAFPVDLRHERPHDSVLPRRARLSRGARSERTVDRSGSRARFGPGPRPSGL